MLPRLPTIFSSTAFLCLALFSNTQAVNGDLPIAAIPSDLQTAPGFKVDLLYAVPKEEQGSWVALTVDHKGRIIAADQYGSLYRLTLPPADREKPTRVEKLAITLPALSDDIPESEVGAHGLLYAFDSLYVMVNEIPGKHGIWRFRDTDGDDQYDQREYILKMNGSGEHGPHAMVLSPDGKSIYFSNGNFTSLPTGLQSSRPVRWGEDHLLPRMWDARGHAKDLYAPGGYIARCDPDGSSVELFAIGFRNQFDIAFDQNGELFSFDSDMEWDLGMPWYMPTRINHVVDAGDYGWRSGAGRWPAYYPDSLPSTIDIGPGSPTGTVFGTGAKFPARYQRALFAADWTYGTLYAIHHEPDGASFRGTKEEFVAGKPLPITDLVVNPHDGALYFAVGGRRTQSAIYRVTYAGTESVEPTDPLPPTPEAKLRREFEALHDPSAGPEVIDSLWPGLGHSDRFIRFAARAAIERQLTANWADRALAEEDPQTAIEALIALARVGEKSLQPRLISALSNFDLAKQPDTLRLPLLRAWHLAFTRMGVPDTHTHQRLLESFDPLFPQEDPFVNRELAALLVYLDSPTIVQKTVPLLSVAEPRETTAEELGGEQLLARNEGYGAAVHSVTDNRADRQQIAFAYTLRNATVGWTPELRREYFLWFPRAYTWRGGASFTGFLDNIRSEALERVPDLAARQSLEKLSKPPVHSITAGATPPKGPGRSYTVDHATSLFSETQTGRDFAQGKAMFASTACIACHRFNNEGSGIGPDLTGAGNRYTIRDLLENIIEPSRVISDQYGSEKLKLADGSTVIGRIVGEESGHYVVMTNPFAPNITHWVEIKQVTSRSNHPFSMMPPGLINALNPEELKDLVAYILSGGNPNDPAFAPAE